MATRLATVEYPNDYTTIITWTGLTFSTTDDGDAVSLPEWADRSVQVTGTLGAGGSVRIAGTNSNGGSPVYHALTNPQGTALNITALGLQAISEVPHKTKPLVTAGDGTTDLIVRMVLRRPRPH